MPSASKKKKKGSSDAYRRWVTHLLKIILSPVIILWDSFRRKTVIDDTWLYSFFLFFTVIISLCMVGLMVTEGPTENVLRMLGNAVENREVLAGDVQPTIDIINKYALKYKIDPNLIFAIIKCESNFQPNAVSRSGARGLMQLMPPVWRKYSQSACTGAHDSRLLCSDKCIFAPEANIAAGVRYLHELLLKYDGRVDLALEAYNAGITNVNPGQKPKFEETRGYLEKTLRYWGELRKDFLDLRLRTTLRLRAYLKWIFMWLFFCWIVLFWWFNRKLLFR